MIDAKDLTWTEIEMRLRAHSGLIDIPGVGIVGHSTPKSVAEMALIRAERALMPSDSLRELCESCRADKHKECTGYVAHGDLCGCDCREV